MKLFLTLCAVVCAAAVCCNAANPEDVEECATKTKTDLKAMADIKIDDDYVPSQSLIDFSACAYKKDGIIKEDGSLDETFGDGKINTLCKLPTKTGNELIVDLMKCFAKHDDAILIESKA